VKGETYFLKTNDNNSNDKDQTVKPKILPLPNGPYYLIHDMEPKIVDNIQNSKGAVLSAIRGVTLCRCGASKNKPFCDGTHSIIGFSSEKSSGGRKDRRIDYAGKNITIHDNRAICSHAAECVDNLSSVFKLNNKPWIDPSGATLDAVIETVRKCPSGALSYSVDGVEYRDQDRESMLTVSKDGPYIITGGIELMGDSQFGEGASIEHYTLCRCGASYNKPFCDGMHRDINFKDEKN
jgi:CDGSH-type Zn-finger protein